MRKILLAALLSHAVAASAAASSVGDWIIDPENDGSPFMFSLNESGAAFGKWCTNETCYWMLITVNKCNEGGGPVPALMSSFGQVQAIQLRCNGPAPNIAGSYRWVIMNPDEIDKQVSASGRIAIAFAVQDTNFQVARFATNLFSQASAQMLAPTLNRQKAKTPKVRSEVL